MNATLRPRLLQVHRWTGLSLGLLLVFLAVTGIGLVFRDQLAPLVEPPQLRPARCAQPVALDAQLAAARAAHPTGKYETLILDEESGAPTLVRFTDDAHVYVDACSGEVVEQRARWGGVFGRLEQLHRFRFLQDKDVANAITGSASIVLMLVMIGGGLTLWWPLRRHGWRSAAALRPHLKGRALDLNLHRTAGLYASVALCVFAVASLPLAFDWARDGLNAVTGSPRPAPKPKSVVPAEGKPLTAGELWRRAQAVLDQPGKVVLAFPKKKTDAVEVYALERGAPHAEARSYLWLDAYSGELLRFAPYVESSPGNKAFRILAAIHKGGYGLGMQLAQFVATLAIPVLGFTGLRSFVRGRRTRRAGAGSLQVRVVDVRDEATAIRSFELASADGKPLPPFTAGAHVNVHLDAETVRQYSLCNDPDDGARYRIAVRLAETSRGGSRALHERVKTGDLLRIDPPRNHFPLDRSATHHLLIAGGIGITPLLSMAQALQRQGRSFELHCFTRSLEHTAFHALLSQARFAGRVHFHYATEPERLRELLRRLLWQRGDGDHLYLCGPKPFMEAVGQAVAGRWPPEAVHVEHFGADPMVHGAPGEAFDVHLRRSQRTLRVPAHRSIADVLVQHGAHVVTSCRQGVCGTCVTGVLEGECDHRDAFLSERERTAGDRIMVCVSRARGQRLVLDL